MTYNSIYGLGSVKRHNIKKCTAIKLIYFFMKPTNAHTPIYATRPVIQRQWAERLRWSRGSVLAFGTQVRLFKPGRSRRIFQGEKNPQQPSSKGK
jgi:uncharacterized membrane protein